MLYSEHPDWPFICSSVLRRAPMGEFESMVWAVAARGLLDHIGEQPLPENAPQPRLPDAAIELLVGNLAQLARDAARSAIDAGEELDAIARTFPEVRAAMDKGDFERAAALAAMHGVDPSLGAPLFEHAMARHRARWRQPEKPKPATSKPRRANRKSAASATPKGRRAKSAAVAKPKAKPRPAKNTSGRRAKPKGRMR